MAITSSYELEGPGFGNGKGNPQPKGNAYGLQKQALKDGVYTVDISGVNVVNHGTPSQDSAQSSLVDGTLVSTEVRQGSVITENGALHLITDSSNGRLRFNTQFDSDQQVKLGELNHLSFDYKVVSSDRSDVIPVIRVAIDGDGNLATTDDRGELVFEYAYQNLGPTVRGANVPFTHVDLIGSDWNAWQRSNGANHDAYPDIVKFSNWSDADGYTAAGGVHFDANSIVLGYSIALGSGNGTTNAYIDNVQIGNATYNFG